MILLIGGSGYIGSAFRRYLELHEEPYVNLSRAEVDYTETAKLFHLLCELKPDFVVNCAGYTGKPNVDACEADRANYLFGNAVLPGRIAEACAQAQIPSGHVSFFENEAEFMREAALSPRSNCVLDSGKLAAHGIHLTEVQQAVELALRDWQAE